MVPSKKAHAHMTLEQATEYKGRKYTSLGSYPLFWLMADGATLSPDTIVAAWDGVCEAIAAAEAGEWFDSGCLPVAVDVNWEDREMYDDETGERIECAYGDRTPIDP